MTSQTRRMGPISMAAALAVSAAGLADAADEGASGALRLHPANPHYFEWRGRPVVLITSAEHYGAVLNLDFDYARYLEALSRDGCNLTRTFTGGAYLEPEGAFKIERNTLAPAPGRFIGPWARSDVAGAADGGTRHDLARWNEAYFARFRDFVSQAARRGVVVEVNLFCPFYKDDQWRLSPFHAANNVNGLGEVARTNVYTVDRHGGLLPVQERMVRKFVDELRAFDNVYYEICNEPYFAGVAPDWQRRIADVITDAQKDHPNPKLIAQNIANSTATVRDPHPAVSILNFHYAYPPVAVAENYGLARVIGENETGFRGTGDDVYRVEAWDFIVAGGGLFNHLDYSFTAGGEDGTFRFPPTQPGGGGVEYRRQLRVLSGFIHRFDFVRMRPADDLVCAGRRDDVSIRVLAEPGRQYAVYIHNSPMPRWKDKTRLNEGDFRTEFALDAPAGAYRAEWIEPATGRVLRSDETIHSGGPLALRSPGYRQDLALRLAAAPQVPSGRIPIPDDLHGGLVLQLGARDLGAVEALARTGRYLVHVLDPDAAAVSGARDRLRPTGLYGVISVERLTDPAHLPFAEDLINLAIVDGVAVPAEELYRAIAPLGRVVIAGTGTMSRTDLEAAGYAAIEAADSALTARKPWPADMDAWSHPRHGADGNAVSDDTRVALPDRVRWIAGATEEIEGVVTAGGRTFYGGILARDGFNGLRLWHRDLGRAQYNLAAFNLPRLGNNRARPVASARRVFAVERDRLVALDAATGEVLFDFPGVTRPVEIASCGDSLVSCDANGVTAHAAETGRLIWRHPAGGARNLAAGDGRVIFLEGMTGSPPAAVALRLDSGAVLWRRDGDPWLRKARRTVLHGDLLAIEVSSFSDHDADNALHVVSAETGAPLWSKAFPPGMNHARQARAMFVGDALWILHGGKTNTVDPERVGRVPIEAVALAPRTGETVARHPAGLAHCFPPVATPNYMFSGVMDLTDLGTGSLMANPITKANCSSENGWIPANGLIYTTPKHCTCWPILRGYVALAPRAKGSLSGADRGPAESLTFALERGPAEAHAPAEASTSSDWPLYRHDPWRSASTPAPGPASLGILWSTPLADGPAPPPGPILHDWMENDYVKGPVSAPTIANGMAFVARPDAHEVLAIETATGRVKWRFTADGRVDTPPAIHRGLCLFGSHGGSVYALCASTGGLVWRLQAAPNMDRIVAYGQVESPWPVSGAVLVMDDVAYFAAGRHSFADGGLLVFAVDPATGRRLWVRRIDTIPQAGYYENSGLEFDPVDILHREGDSLALSRWIIARDGTSISVDKWNAFAKLDTGGGAVWVPRGCWTYGPRHQARFRGEAKRRPLCAFRDHIVLGSFNGSTALFRRDFAIEDGEVFNSRWITGWEAGKIANEGGNPYRDYRLAEKALWRADPFTSGPALRTPRTPGTQLHNEIFGLAFAGDGRLFAVHKDGRLKVISVADGKEMGSLQVPPPAWDTLAIAERRLYLVSQSGDLLCIGERQPEAGAAPSAALRPAVPGPRPLDPE